MFAEVGKSGAVMALERLGANGVFQMTPIPIWTCAVAAATFVFRTPFALTHLPGPFAVAEAVELTSGSASVWSVISVVPSYSCPSLLLI